MSLIINTVKNKNKVYIVCEKSELWGNFANGAALDHWILEYKNNKLRYVASLTQTEGGSSGFVYTAYSFQNGKVKASEVYYADEETRKKPKYTKYSTALTAFYNQYGISVNSKNLTGWSSKMYKSVLAKKNKPTQQFVLFNKCTSRNYKTGKYKYKATIKARNKFN